MDLVIGLNNVFLNKMLNFNNPVSLTCKSLHELSLVLGRCLGFFFFLSVVYVFSISPPSICLLVDENTQAGSGHGEWSVGPWCAREFSERENLPNWLLILDLLFLQWEVLRFCFPSLMLKQKLYLWATVFGMGVFQF